MPDSPVVKLTCPACGAPLDFDGSSTVVHCKFCRNVAIIPHTGQTSAPQKADSEVLDAIKNGDKAEAIKFFRAVYDADFQDAKSAVEVMMEFHPIDASGFAGEIKELVDSGDKTEAIKRYREKYDVSMAAARDAIDRIAGGGGFQTVQVSRTMAQTAPAKDKVNDPSKGIGLAIALAVVLLVGGILVFVMSQTGGGMFAARLYAAEPARLISVEGAASPELIGLFYEPGADTRSLGLLGADGKLRWKSGALPGSGNVDGVVADVQNAYAASGMELFAWNRLDGSLVWKTAMTDKIYPSSSTMIVLKNEILVWGMDDALQAYSTLDGSQLWTRQMKGADRAIRSINGAVVVLDYGPEDSDQHVYYLDPASGHEKFSFLPSCQLDEYRNETLNFEYGLVFDEPSEALYLLYDTTNCIQRISLKDGSLNWQTLDEQDLSFSFYGFNHLEDSTAIYLGSGSRLLAVDRNTGAINTLLDDESYNFVPLALNGNGLLVRAERTRGSKRFALWLIDKRSGEKLWQVDMQTAEPVETMAGLVDKEDTAWTWHAGDGGLTLLSFKAEPHQIILQTLDWQTGQSTGGISVALKDVSGDFYSVPNVIGWHGSVFYAELDGKIYALDVSSGKFVYKFQ